MATLAERLNSWFADAATPDAVGRLREPSTSEVAQAISQDPSHDVTISRSYLTALRNGSQTNPTVSVLSAIVKYFQSRDMSLPVSVSALINEEPPGRPAKSQDGWATALADRQVQSIAMRAGRLTPELREQLLSIMDVLDASKKASPSADAGKSSGDEPESG
ncbi:hypothetical protein [Streptomyces sp. NRRL S-1022]|uniref:hypothetical protein n=1 Tax=Streptomyces sp. NRRL S-1022 TaxID=1463880 RepID=UPI00068A9939|nr:hypothetical protein [Streptomyces sp. NRRL S-1022]